jgi:hypothetical protein
LSIAHEKYGAYYTFCQQNVHGPYRKIVKDPYIPKRLRAFSGPCFYLGSVGNKLGEVLCSQNFSAVDVKSFNGVAETFFGFEGLNVDDLFGI